MHTKNSNFINLLTDNLSNFPKEKSIVTGKVVKILNGYVYIDINSKSEGRIPVNEFEKQLPYLGQSIEVFLEKLENQEGYSQISKKKAINELTWNIFNKCFIDNSNLSGFIIGKVNKGGFAVLIDGIFAFLPGSQLDIRPIKNISKLINTKQLFKIIKIDKKQGNIVVSRRIVLEESRKESKDSLLSIMKEGMLFNGVVKNITNYGAFIDLGDIDGLLHITDISWNKITHPSEKIFLGQKLKVIVTRYNPKDRRVSLGLKQLTNNPWKGLEKKYYIGSIHKGKVLSVSDYGVFVELEPSIEGLVYLNEIDWNSKNYHPTKLANINDNIKVKILDIDINKHRISLSIKQCYPNPWKNFIKKYPVGTSLEVIITKIVSFGLFANVLDKSIIYNLDLLIPAFEIDIDEKPINSLKKIKVGTKVFCVIISSNLNKERITLSIKQWKERQYKLVMYNLISSNFVKCKILNIIPNEGLYVEIMNKIRGVIKKSDLSKNKELQNTKRFSIGQVLKAKVISFDKKKKLLYLSIKILEILEEKKSIKKYMNTSSLLNLGDILVNAIKTTKTNI